ncbi:tyrosine kinase receptor Cad96Ca-like [Amphiura filiformis]|uniref:tyrosine kinase receptor Cad96Ca-like n=1 Tax=Amphiura filiformis TaxID=82378 RepID=UPI003B20EE04
MGVNEKLLIAMVILMLGIISDVHGYSMDSVAEPYLISGLLVGVALIISILFVIALCAGQSRPNSSASGSIPLSNGRPGMIPAGTIAHRPSILNGYDIQLQNMLHQQVRDRFTFPRQNLTFIKELGVGQYGVVHLAKAVGISERSQWISNMVAVKTVKANARSLDKVNFLRELDLMKKLRPHPNVLGLMGCCVEKEPFLIIVEYVANGNLLQLLERSRMPYIASLNQSYRQPVANPVNQRTLLLMAKYVADGMAHLASQKCIHRDLAARNVLVGADYSCKVSDFGRAVVGTYVVDSGIKFEGPLPLRWMAIESLIDDIHTSLSDVWGFGVLLWEITTLGARPYGGMAPKQVVEFVRRGYRMERPVHCSVDVYNVMMACWSTDPDRRPTFTQLSVDIGRILNLKTDYVSLNRIDRRLYDGDRTFVDPFEHLDV